MGEIKSVKVDNWGVFFLQKLQNFFNKTDYCDLTLQFNDNSQLKVHRLVLSACTDYFNVLEQTCEMIEDILIMPLELQADVVVPIVNFMYTGTLEFELRMYGRLLKTARDMNMTVLLKLLEAHRRTMERNPVQPILNRNTQRNAITYQKRTGGSSGTAYHTSNTSTAAQRRNQPATTIKALQIKPVSSYYSNTTVQNTTKYIPTKPVRGPSRFDYPPEGKVLPPETFEQSFDTISYESKPLICKEEPDSEDYESMIQKHEPCTSQFEELRRGYNNNKRPASSVSSFESPPDKKPNIQDVKEYAEQQRMRKQIAQEYDDDNEYEETLDDEFHNDDDDEDYVPPSSYQKQTKTQQQKQKPASSSQQQQQPIIIKQENNRPTIVVKDSPNSTVNHAKIISEVLKKYPHLVKNNKNIKLKILPKSEGGRIETQKIIFKKELVEQKSTAAPKLPQPNAKQNTYRSAQRPSGASTSKNSVQQKYESPPTKTSTSSKPSTSETSATASSSSSQPRRIDSKTMHSLIAMGAENRTGPWLCLQCGVNGRPISMPSYRGFRRHLINTHKEKIDPRLCEHCGWRSTNNRELYHHMFIEHKIKPPSGYTFPKCELCDEILISYSELGKHLSENHDDVIEVNQSCIYCNATFPNEIMLYAHMKAKHKERAKQDGVMDFSDDELAFESDSQYQSDGGEKIKIISDISLPKNIPVIHAANNAPGTTITLPPEFNETSQGPKFVNADGKEMELTDEQRQEIISQLEDQDHGAVVMVLNDDNIVHETALQETTSTTEDLVGDQSKSSTQGETAIEKEQHKPRKTKHTVKTEIEDVEVNEEMIEWLDEESGNIMKVPVSKFSKIGELEEGDEEEEATEEEDESIDEGKIEKKSKNEITKSSGKKSLHEKNKSVADKKDSKSQSKEKEEIEADEDASEPEKEIKNDKSEDVLQKKKNNIGKKDANKAMEALKILTGDWTDEDDDEQKILKTKNEDESKSESSIKDSISNEEIIFEKTVAMSELDVKSDNDRDKNESQEKVDKTSDRTSGDEKGHNEDNEMDTDATISDANDLLKSVVDEDNKLDDVMDDDMRIIEELKNYEEEQLAAENAEKSEKDGKNYDDKRTKKLKLSLKSTSPTVSESSNKSRSSSSSTNSASKLTTAGTDKPRKRGRPRKSEKVVAAVIEKERKSEEEKEKEKETLPPTTTATTPESIEMVQKSEKESEEKHHFKEDKEDISKVEDRIIFIEKQSEDDDELSKSEDAEHAVEEEIKKMEDNIPADDGEVEEEKSVTDDSASLMTKAEIRNLISDWGDDDDDL